MLSAEYIMGAVKAETESRIRVYPVHNLRASNIGHPCERYLYLLISHWEEQKMHDFGLQSIFDLGNTMEEYTINKLKAAGLEVITPVVRSWKIENPLITGREDIRIKDPEDGQFYPAEIKGLSPYEWEKLNSVEDFYNSKKHYVRAYPSQLLCYMFKFEKEKGFFILTNKLTGQIKVIEVPFDWDRADELLKKGERIYSALADKTGKTLPAACDDMTVCQDCQMRHICTSAAQPTELEIDTGELEDMITRKEELSAAVKEHKELDSRIKAAIGDREKILAGQYIITVKTIQKGEYTVSARSERRINISRI